MSYSLITWGWEREKVFLYLRRFGPRGPPGGGSLGMGGWAYPPHAPLQGLPSSLDPSSCSLWPGIWSFARESVQKNRNGWSGFQSCSQILQLLKARGPLLPPRLSLRGLLRTWAEAVPKEAATHLLSPIRLHLKAPTQPGRPQVWSPFPSPAPDRSWGSPI